MSVATAPEAPAQFEWRRWPDTEAFVGRLISTALEGHPFAARLAERMMSEAGTPFEVWVDHLVITGTSAVARTLSALGYDRQPGHYAVGVPAYAHPVGILPSIA